MSVCLINELSLHAPYKLFLSSNAITELGYHLAQPLNLPAKGNFILIFQKQPKVAKNSRLAKTFTLRSY